MVSGNGGGTVGGRSSDLALVLYRELRAREASSLPAVAAELGLTDDELDRCRAELVGLGLVIPTGRAHDNRLELEAGGASEAESDAVTVVTPEIALCGCWRRSAADCATTWTCTAG
ncbi:hypothetical protein [Streptomyces capparidis]